jgi:hypothetical protein
MRYRLVFLKVQGIVVVDRMLKAMIKSLENKHLSPGPLGPFLPTNWEKNLNYY